MIAHITTYCTLALKHKIRLKSWTELEAYEKGYFAATALYNLKIREDQVQYICLSGLIRDELGLREHQSWMARLRYDAMNQETFLGELLRKINSLKSDLPEISFQTINVEKIFQGYIPDIFKGTPGLTIFKQIIINQNILSDHYNITSFYDLEFFVRGFRESLEYKNMNEVTGLHDPYLRLFTDIKSQNMFEYYVAKRCNISPVSTFGQMLDYFADYGAGYNLFLDCIDGFLGEPRN